MKTTLRKITAAAVILAFGGAALLSQVFAQSEYLSTDRMPYNAFDRLPTTDVEVGGGTIRVAFAPGEISLPKEQVVDWIRRSAKAVTAYYGRFPVKTLKLLMVPVDGRGIQGGTTWGYRGAAIRIVYGRDSTERNLKNDWIMVHEMTHLALPDLDSRFGWLSEGAAVYIEPIARVQAGDLDAADVWGAMMKDMPQGLPRTGDQGLDNTDTWGRKYWGGAIFCLLADIDIRKKTGNRMGLQDAMRGLLAAGGNHENAWPLLRVIGTADKATSTDVLATLHDELGPKPVNTDLNALWRELGLSWRDGSVVMDNTAPLAAIRDAIMKPRKG